MKKGYYILIIAVSLLLLAATFFLLLEPNPSLVERFHNSAIEFFSQVHIRIEAFLA